MRAARSTTKPARLFLICDYGDGLSFAAKMYPGNWPGQGPIAGDYANAQRIAEAKQRARAWWVVEAVDANEAKVCVGRLRWAWEHKLSHSEAEQYALPGVVVESGCWA